MRALVVLGVVLIVLGLVALAWQGVTYTTHEKVLDLGPFKASVEREKTVVIPPAASALAVAAGIVLVVVGARRR